MKPANPRAYTNRAHLPLVLLACLAWTCAATPPPSPPKPTANEQALIDILSAQSYAATVANAAGTARAKDQINEAVYRTVIASGTALDVAWREAVQALLADADNLQEKLDVMAEKRHNLEELWRAATGRAIEIPGKGGK